ncbi:FecR family protein [Variovorax paradoxus]|uniref:Anti-FecI sigma factor, FecR n=1 Tax=Variovorax paradoxus (strain EPS) TaxID=595537 RepID=E6V9K2_VARPE|nr:FecR domain-containing protein [Variovorax paradoxus]ADU35050.1 anti-FecI sigma factor, FecR [Variovorax paradoxus EPS]
MTAPSSPRSGLPAAPPSQAGGTELREHAEFFEAQDAADVAAADWLVRRQEGLDAAQEAQFQAWLTARPSHQAAFERLAGVWDRLDALPADRTAKLGRQAHASIRAQAGSRAEPPRRARPFDFGRWVPLAAAACVALVVAGGWMGWDYWQHQPTYSKTFATARGQQLDVQLPDGSRLQLDTATRAEVTLYRQRREVRLPEGQAMFTVQHDAGHPFDVLAGPLRITVVGTRFSVRNTGTGLGADGVRVTVEEGRVRVAPTDTRSANPAAPVLLGAGEAVAADPSGALRKPVDTSPTNATLWREGRVNFENTPLSQALAEFERYGPTRLTLRDPMVAAMRINGSFDLRQLGAFTKALPQVLPVQLHPRGAETEISAADRPGKS